MASLLIKTGLIMAGVRSRAEFSPVVDIHHDSTEHPVKGTGQTFRRSPSAKFQNLFAKPRGGES